MEELVVTIETAKKLKSAGFPCGYLGLGKNFSWYEVEKKTTGEIRAYVHPGYNLSAVSWRTLGRYAAPTAQEVADQLDGRGLCVQRAPQDVQDRWQAYATDGTAFRVADIYGDTMAEALAALWLQLHTAQTAS